ncbi:Nn.00g061130.m01.CDS01 [Neocucurbitaria sp. VM-36]
MEFLPTSVFVSVATITSPPTIPVTLMPRVAPSIGSTSRDEWQCYTENIDQYFQGPNPTGALDYAEILNSDSTIIMPETGTVLPTCPFPGQEK